MFVSFFPRPAAFAVSTVLWAVFAIGLLGKRLVDREMATLDAELGDLDGRPILTSETCALDMIGAKYVRDIEPGEIIVFDEAGAHSHKPFPPKPPRPCIFEYIYFSRPDSIVGGRSVYEVRKAFGAQLARESHVDIDVVVPVPDSGVPAAIGYSQHSGVPFELGIIRNHYVGRTFIQPTHTGRQKSISRKHAPNRPLLDGKRVILVDDSIVRGTTSRKIVKMVRAAGARVAMRSSGPERAAAPVEPARIIAYLQDDLSAEAVATWAR